METKKIVIIDLKENLNKIDNELVLHLSQRDIGNLKLMRDILKEYFGRPWIYAGSGIPRAPKEEMLREIDKMDLDDRKKKDLKALAVEKELPAEVLVVIEEGDGEHLHSHEEKVSSDFQMEQYLIPEDKKFVLEMKIGEDIETIEIRGPSVLILGDIVHQRVSGECFVVKFPSGEYKKTIT